MSRASFEGKHQLIYHYSWYNLIHFLKKMSAHLIRLGPNPNALRVEMMKECSTESNAFSTSAENKMASVSFSSVYSRMS